MWDYAAFEGFMQYKSPLRKNIPSVIENFEHYKFRQFVSAQVPISMYSMYPSNKKMFV